MSMRKIAVLLVFLLGGLTAIEMVLAQTSTNFDLTWSVLGGGASISRSASFDLGGTVGQTAPDTSAGTNFRLGAGFWPGMVASGSSPVATPTPPATAPAVPTPPVYLPLILRTAPPRIARAAFKFSDVAIVRDDPWLDASAGVH
jgi:hypothetical protein